MNKEIDLCKLKEPFESHHVEWRVQRSGENNGNYWAMVLAYITNRAIMDRLDEVCGMGNWRNEFKEAPLGGVLCGISIKTGGEWVTKWDGSSNTDIEAVKGGLSSSMKRAGSQWGIGRYLYGLESNFADVTQNGKHSAKTKEGKWFKWDEPDLPKWALPDPVIKTKELQKPFIERMTLIKESIDTEDYALGAAAWFESDSEDKKIMWISTSNGGFFSPDDRKTIQSTEFKESHFGK